MPNVPMDFPFGNKDELSVDKLLVIIQDMYELLARAVNSKPDIIVSESDGSADDVSVAIGSLSVNTSSNKVEMLTSATTEVATWTTLS